MKDYREVADNVLRRGAEILSENRRRNRRLLQIGAATACFCLIALLGVGVWKSGVTPGAPLEIDSAPQSVGADTAAKAETDGKNPSTSAPGNAGSAENPSASAPGSAGSAQNPPTSAPDNGNAANPPATGYFCLPAGSQTEIPPMRTVISGYGNVGSYSYEAPENGRVTFSVPLTDALNAYGATDENGEILYRVVVCVFRDKAELNAGSDEIAAEGDRLFTRGYTVAMEDYFDGTQHHRCFTLHATADQLRQFAPNAAYGYRLYLYDELVPQH